MAARSIGLVLCVCTLAGSSRTHAGRTRNMLDRNRTPGRDSRENEEPVRAMDICDLRGAWYNQHGSELILNQTDDGQLSGEFRSAVHLSRRRQNQDYTEHGGHWPVLGSITGQLFTFHVHWRDSNSMSTWSGQCQRGCDLGWLRSDREVLHASWLLVSATDTCDDYWKATRIGEDIFTRLPMKAGPRKETEISAVQTA